MKAVIVIIGPIASGKTTIGREVARELTRQGSVARAIDIDPIILAIDPNDSFKLAQRRRKTWDSARHQIIQEAERLFASGVDVVTVAAPLFYDSGLSAFRAELDKQYQFYVFKLKTPYPWRLLRFMRRHRTYDVTELDKQDAKLARHPTTAAGAVVTNIGSIATTINAIVELYSAGYGEVSDYFGKSTTSSR